MSVKRLADPDARIPLEALDSTRLTSIGNHIVKLARLLFDKRSDGLCILLGSGGELDNEDLARLLGNLLDLVRVRVLRVDDTGEDQDTVSLSQLANEAKPETTLSPGDCDGQKVRSAVFSSAARSAAYLGR